ncbi:MAG: hypothetical protein ACTHNU_00705, partial [Gaiellales bacterium]
MPARDGTLTGHRREAADRRLHALGGELPGLATAFEPDAAAFALEDVLRPREDWRVTGCQLEHAMYRPGGAGCAVRFQLTLAGPDGRNMHPLVNGRLFSSRLAAARHLRRDLLPLVDRAGRRGEFELLSSVAGVVDQMAMAVSVYPVDGRLPALVDATDPAQMRWRLAEATGAPVTACAITRDRYGRGNRCILRYTLERSGGRETIVGKLTGGRGGEAAHRAVRELMRRPSTGRRRFHVPRSPGYLPDLQMLLLETVHGGPELSRRLKRFTHGRLDVMPALETGMAESAEVAAALHGTPLSGLPGRTARAE